MLRQKYKIEHFDVIPNYCIIQISVWLQFLHISCNDGECLRFIGLFILEGKLVAIQFEDISFVFKLLLYLSFATGYSLLLVFAKSLKKLIFSFLRKLCELNVGNLLLKGLIKQKIRHFIENWRNIKRIIGLLLNRLEIVSAFHLGGTVFL